MGSISCPSAAQAQDRVASKGWEGANLAEFPAAAIFPA
mgnify:CR=1 FL=1|jgi:hypothetical protein